MMTEVHSTTPQLAITCWQSLRLAAAVQVYANSTALVVSTENITQNWCAPAADLHAGHALHA